MRQATSQLTRPISPESRKTKRTPRPGTSRPLTRLHANSIDAATGPTPRLTDASIIAMPCTLPRPPGGTELLISMKEQVKKAPASALLALMRTTKSGLGGKFTYLLTYLLTYLRTTKSGHRSGTGARETFGIRITIGTSSRVEARSRPVVEKRFRRQGSIKT